MKIRAKQIDKLIGTKKRVNSAITILTGTSAYVTTPSFAGSGGAGSDTVAGVFTTAPANIVSLYRRLTGKEVRTADDRRIFARTTFAATVFTTTLYVSDGAGGETVYAPIAGDNLNNVVVDIVFGESVQLDNLLPTQTVNGMEDVDETSLDPNSHQRQIDVFAAPTNGQTAFALTQTPKAGSVEMKINGVDQLLGTDYSVAASTVTFAAVDHSIATTDRVQIAYDR